MDEIYLEYWLVADNAQQQLDTKITRHIQRLYPQIQDLSDRFSNLDIALSPTRRNNFHRQLDRLRDVGYYGSSNLKAQAQLLRRRQHIEAQQAFELLMFSEFANRYNEIWKTVEPVYQNIFLSKYKEFTGIAFDDTIPLVLTLSGDTPLERLLGEAEYRSKLISDSLYSIKLDDTWDGDIQTPVVADSLMATKNRLLKQSSKGGWHGILDDIMTLYVGYSATEAGKYLGGKYKFHAIIDERTTKICRSLNGKIFDVSEMVIGVNLPPTFPPYHPCRSWIEFING